MARDPFQYFRVEARELTEQLAKGVLQLENGPSKPDDLARLLRLAHTLKGAARVVKQREIADLAHSIEDILSPFRNGPAVPGESADEVLRLLDAIGARMLALSSPPQAADGTAPALPRAAADEPVRIQGTDVEELEAVVDGVTEAHVQLSGLGRSGKTMDRLRHLSDLLADQLASPRSQRAADGAAVKLRSIADELRSEVSLLERGFATGVEQIDRELRQVREHAERLLLTRASVMFNSLERAARDAARSLGREVGFETKGGDVRLDTQVLGPVQNALVQAVRNAVAHGIEDPSERVSKGKPPEGRVTVEAIRRGNRVAFICRDDGRGVDYDAVRRFLEARSPETGKGGTASAEELLQLLMKGGISTARQLTEVSGRGVGLDVVREVASRLSGEAALRSEPGQGTTLEMVVPVTLSSLDVLVVEAAGQAAAIRLDDVRRVLRVLSGDVVNSAGGAAIKFESQVVPFAPLARLLHPASAAPKGGRTWPAVVVEGAGTLAAVGIDRLLGAETIVQRSLPALTPAYPFVGGLWLDSEGNPRVVLETEALVGAVKEAISAEPALPARPPILVIDDSMTTRMLEQSILESAGYEVEVAASAEEALDKLRGNSFSLILVDVEMPGMDGFGFISWLRGSPAHRDIPALLVTSRSAPEDRKRGEEVGATAYIAKSEFDQVELLDRIRRLVG